MQFRHKKTGKVYRIMMLGVQEATLTPIVAYAGEDGLVWTRPATEFFDGRFELFLPVVGPAAAAREYVQ